MVLCCAGLFPQTFGKEKLWSQEVSGTLFQSRRLVWAGQFVWAAISQAVGDTAVAFLPCEAALSQCSSGFALLHQHSWPLRRRREGKLECHIYLRLWDIKCCWSNLFSSFLWPLEFIMMMPSDNYALWHFERAFWDLNGCALFLFPNLGVVICYSSPYHC